ncbi:MAG: ABC transporter substrate-binding protein, partial [Oscillospiraceae bacterium]|nr:ABC transporter substrate-binding protein [Oscillospiraceae bacterium]
MSRNARTPLLAALALSAALSAASCASYGDDIPPPGESASNMSVYGGDAEAKDRGPTLHGSLELFSMFDDYPNPICSPSIPYPNYLRLIYDGLVDLVWSEGVRPNLALAWQPSGDSMVWTVTIRTDARWHDGGPLTTADVRYTVEEIAKRRYSAYYPNVSNVASV